MSNITFHVELDNKKRSDGTQNIRIRITQNRKSKRTSLGVSVLESEWNDERKEVRRTNSQHKQINTLIKHKLLDLERTYLDNVVMERTVSAGHMASKLRNEVLGDSYLQFADARIKKMVSPATRKAQTSVIKKLREYMKNKDLYFLDITFDFLQDYERYMKRDGNSLNTIHANMKTIKAIYNEARKSGHFIPDKVSPWELYRAKKEKSKRTKLTEKQLKEFEALVIRPGINEWHSRNIFLLSFYLQGMRTADILQLTWGQIVDDRVEYVAGKTGKYRSKMIVSKAKEILAHYRYPGLKPTNYVFPFLKGKIRKQFTDDEWLKAIGNANALINGHLKNIGKRIGVAKISMHVARHTFADIARRKTGDVYAVSGALDHSSINVTQDYFAAESKAENDNLARSVYGE